MNTKDEAQPQKQSEFSCTTSKPNVKMKVQFELDYHLGDDSDVTCLDESMEISSIVEVPPVHELFHLSNDIANENLIAVPTEPSHEVIVIKHITQFSFSSSKSKKNIDQLNFLLFY